MTKTIKSMTFNIRNVNPIEDTFELSWDVRKEYVIKLIKEENPDILCLEEATKVQLEFMISELYEYNYCYKYREIKENPECCPLFYKKDRFSLIKEESFWLSETPSIMSKGWDARCYRICTVACLLDNACNKNIVVYSTHLDHRSDTARQKGLELINNHYNANCSNYPVIITGDFNAPPTDHVIKDLFTLFDDPADVNKEDKDKYTYQGYLRRDPPERIDYFAVKGLDSLSYKVIDKTFSNDTYNLIFPSDHYPITSEFKYKENIND